MAVKALPFQLHRPNLPTCDHRAGIPRWLGVEIVWILMDDHRTSKYLADVKPLIIKCSPRIALVGKQRNHIAGMIGMQRARCAEIGLIVYALYNFAK